MDIMQKTKESLDGLLQKTQQGAHEVFQKTQETINKQSISALESELTARKDAAAKGFQDEIEKLKEQKNNILAHIGRKYHDARNGNGEADANEMHDMVNDIDNKINEQTNLKEAATKKYEEAMQLLKETAPVAKEKAQAVVATCTNCGKKFTHQVHMFCAECGQDLRGILPDQAQAAAHETQNAAEGHGVVENVENAVEQTAHVVGEVGGHIAEEVKQEAAAPLEGIHEVAEELIHKCPSCGEAYNHLTAVFCKNCGKNLKE